MIRLTLLTYLIFTFNVALCCDCNIDSFEMARDSSEAIFTGSVTQIVDDLESCYMGDCIAVYVTLKVDENIKGDKDRIIIHTMKYTASCGFPFEIGKDYLVYAYLTENRYRTRLCSRTIELSHERAQTDIEKLKE